MGNGLSGSEIAAVLGGTYAFCIVGSLIGLILGELTGIEALFGMIFGPPFLLWFIGIWMNA